MMVIMTDFSNKSKKIDFQKRLIQCGRKFIIETYNDIGINPPDESLSDYILAEELVNSIINDNTKIEYIELISKFIDISSELESIPKNYLFDSIPLKGREKTTIKTPKADLIHHIRKLILRDIINIEDFKKTIENASVISRVKKIRDVDAIIVLASKLGEDVDNQSDKEKLVKKIYFGLKSGKYHPEDVEKYLSSKKSKKGKSSGKTDKLVKEVETINARVLSIEKELQIQKSMINKIDAKIIEIANSINQNTNVMHSYYNYIKSYFNEKEADLNIARTEKLITALRKEKLNVTTINPNLFDSLKISLNNNNIADFDILRDGLAVMTMDYIMKLTDEVDWKISLDLFYRILYEETIKLVGSANYTVKIPLIRNSVTERMNLPTEKFDSLLLECREKDWVLLEVGTPIGETDAGWLDTGKNRFYYLKLLKK